MTTTVPPICTGCKHLKGNLINPHCDAFKEIPWDILLSKVDHRKPFSGDNGIQFKPKTSRDADYAALVFDDEAK